MGMDSDKANGLLGTAVAINFSDTRTLEAMAGCRNGFCQYQVAVFSFTDMDFRNVDFVTGFFINRC